MLQSACQDIAAWRNFHLDLLDGRVGGREPVELRDDALPLGPLAAHHIGGGAGVDARDDGPVTAQGSARAR